MSEPISDHPYVFAIGAMSDALKWEIGDLLLALCGSPDEPTDVSVADVAHALKERGNNDYTAADLRELRRVAWHFPPERRSASCRLRIEPLAPKGETVTG